MARDILDDLGYLALGSRLKRLAERLQAEAMRTYAELDYPTQPGHFPLMAALDAYGPMTVGEAVDCIGVSQPAITRTQNALINLGFVETRPSSTDQRISLMSLTETGQQLIQSMKQDLWPQVERAARTMCCGPDADLLGNIRQLETAMSVRSLDERVRADRQTSAKLSIRAFDDSLAPDFYEITREWVEDMFSLEHKDLEIIQDPRGMIMDRGGDILFVETEDLGVIGTCALMPVEGKAFELTKMGVKASARGRKAGEFLLERVLDRARQLDIEELFLLTNQKCQAAIHLYEKSGFVHDPDIMKRYGARYERCDVAMSYPLQDR